jgi:hypothetical protein
MHQNPVSVFSGPASPVSGDLLFQLQIELLFELMFKRTRQQAALDSQARQSARG